MAKVAAVAEAQQHHPRWENEWSVVQIWLTTHSEQNQITQKDYDLAEAIDNVFEEKPEKQIREVQNDVVRTTKKGVHVSLYSDGGSRGNPGPSAAGWVILDDDNNVLVDDYLYLGVTTNNQAEYIALKQGLLAAKKAGARYVDCYSDSMLVVKQMHGQFKIKNRDLWPVHAAIKQLAEGFAEVTYTHVPREHNQLADAAVNRALDEHLKT